MNYDQSIEELENIVNKLSDENLSVEESIKLYSKGISLAKNAMDSLSVFKGKIELLNKDLSALQIEEEDDEDEEDYD